MVVDFRHVMDLCMTVMTRRDAVLGLGRQNLVGFCLAVSPALLLKAGLQVPAAAAAAEVVGPVGGHVDKVFFTNHCFDNVSEVFCNGIAKGFTYQLARVLDREFDLAVFVPV